MTSFACARALRVFALLALPVSVSAQSRQSRQTPTIFSPASQMGTVTVRVAVVLADYSVKPLPLLNVVARRTDRSDSVSAQTDLDGRATLPLRVGSYTVRAKSAQPIAGKSYAWSVLVTVRPSRAELVQLTNANASVDSAATLATVAAAPVAPPASVESTRPVVTTPKPASSEKAVALEKPATPAAPPASVESTRPVTMTPKPTQPEKTVAIEKPVATQKKVVEAPTPTPATAPTTAPAKALATAPATAPAKTPAAVPAKAQATVPAKAPTTGPEKAIATAIAPAPAKVPATAPSKAQAKPPASETARAEPSSYAPPTKAVAVASTPAPARTRRVQPRVNTSNLLLGLSFDASSIRSEFLGPSTGTGVGVAGQLGWGVGKYFALVADASGARIGSLDGNFDLAHLDVGGRLHLVTGRSAFVPFVEGGYAWRVVRKDGAVMTDPAGNLYTGDMAIGSGFSLGGGLQYFVAPTVAFGGAFKWTTGKFSRLQFDGAYVDGLAMDATSTRFNLGFTWYPMGH
jgi:hypothetical protein